MNVGSLFSGIGGIDLGLERAGMRIAWQCERDPWCQQVLFKHWPDVPRYHDVRLMPADDIEPIDVLAGGFPCQPVSTAGERRGTNDERWLWPEFARLVRLLRPRFVLVENVPGLLSVGMGDVLGDLAACGYDAEWDSIGAIDVGAPHRRKRAWIVAYPANDIRRQDHRGLGGSEAQSGGETSRRVLREGNGATWDDGPTARGGWPVEPDVGRVADGVPRRVDRLRGLGNAAVPQVVEWIGRRMMAATAAHNGDVT